jgi:hypothetical protein
MHQNLKKSLRTELVTLIVLIAAVTSLMKPLKSELVTFINSIDSSSNNIEETFEDRVCNFNKFY